MRNRRNPHIRLTDLTRGVWAKAAIAVYLTAGAPSAFAHVALDAPSGGENLLAGSVKTIVWHDEVEHGPATYDLFYSLTGPGGPWIDIASDLPPGQSGFSHAYEWTVPDSESQAVRISVFQVNSGPDYNDVSAENFSIVPAVTAASVTLEPSQDTTLYEGDGSLANGAGIYLFTGLTEAQNSSLERRALLAFDVADAVPAGSTVTAVTLELNMSRTTSGSQQVGLHQVLESWTEGPSDALGQEGGGASAETGDATWVHRSFPNSTWATEGGSFAAQASANLTIGQTGSYAFDGNSQLIGDVQEWLDSPDTNFGWVLLMPSPTTGSAKRFDSRENSSTSVRPKLVIAYDEPTAEAPTADFTFAPESPIVGEAIQFTDLSLGSPTEWSWTFGDGADSDRQNPTHSFASAGDFTVDLSVSNDGGSDTFQMIVSVQPGEGPELTELVVIPAAANSPGFGPSFFVTTVDVHNPDSASASFAFLWFPRNTDNSEPERSGVFSLDPGRSMRFHNLVGGVFGRDSAAGAAGVISDSAVIEVMSRTFNQTLEGTFGQSLPGVPSDELIAAGNRVRILFLTEDGDFRSNLGLVNGVASPILVQWELFDNNGASLRTGEATLPAWGNFQINRILADFAPLEAAYADVWTTTTGGAFTCYGSVLDAVSSDGTTILPR